MSFWHVNHWKERIFVMYKIETWVTLAVLVAASAVVGLMAWIEKKPKTELQPRLLPTTLIMIIFGITSLMALFHLVDVLKSAAGQ
jgi:hypothetical protein